MSGNEELLNALEGLSRVDEEVFFEKIKPLKAFLGPKSSAVYPTDRTKVKAKVLHTHLLPLSVSEITIEGPPSLIEIIQSARRQLALAETLQWIKRIDASEDINEKRLKYLESFIPADDDAKFQKFCEDNFLNNDAAARQAFEIISAVATQRKQNILDATTARSAARINALKDSIVKKVEKLHAVFENIISERGKIEDTLEIINNKKTGIQDILREFDNRLAAANDKTEKESIQKQIDNHKEQLKFLQFTESKLESIQHRLNHRYEKANENLRTKFFYVYRKIKQAADINFDMGYFGAALTLAPGSISDVPNIANEAYQEMFYYQIERDTFKYKVKNLDGIRDYGEIELPPGHDFSQEATKKYIFDRLVARGYIITKKYEPFVLGKPSAGIAADEKTVASLAAVLSDLEEDVERCQRAIHLAELTAADPKKQLHAKLSANTFMDVMSLADINSFNEKGEPYFRDEIIDEKTQEIKRDDLRTKFGLEGEVITRGVMLKPGEVARSSYTRKDPRGSKGQDTEIIIDTKFVKSKLTREHTIAKTELIWQGDLTIEEKKQAAFRYARKLLMQYTEGDPQSKITLKAGRNQPLAEAQEQANMVYAAILMLTSEETAGKKCIKVPSDKLSINVKGVGPDLFGAWPWKRKQEFINKYFDDKDERTKMGAQVTEEYRALRKGISKESKKAIIVEAAVDDIHQVSLQKK